MILNNATWTDHPNEVGQSKAEYFKSDNELSELLEQRNTDTALASLDNVPDSDSQNLKDIVEKRTDIDSVIHTDDFRKDERAISEARIASITNLIMKVKDMPPICNIFRGINRGGVGILFGPPKGGKTIFAESLGLSIAAGLNHFLGEPLADVGKKVLFISLEEHVLPERREMSLKLISFLASILRLASGLKITSR